MFMHCKRKCFCCWYRRKQQFIRWGDSSSEKTQAYNFSFFLVARLAFHSDAAVAIETLPRWIANGIWKAVKCTQFEYLLAKRFLRRHGDSSELDAFFSYTSSRSDKYQSDKRHESYQNVITGEWKIWLTWQEKQESCRRRFCRVENTFIYSFVNQLSIVLLIGETLQHLHLSMLRQADAPFGREMKENK